MSIFLRADVLELLVLSACWFGAGYMVRWLIDPSIRASRYSGRSGENNKGGRHV